MEASEQCDQFFLVGAGQTEVLHRSKMHLIKVFEVSRLRSMNWSYWSPSVKGSFSSGGGSSPDGGSSGKRSSSGEEPGGLRWSFSLWRRSKLAETPPKAPRRSAILPFCGCGFHSGAAGPTESRSHTRSFPFLRRQQPG